MLAAKRLAGVAPEVNLREYVTHMPLPSSNKAAHSCFETQRRRHQKSKTWVSVAPRKGLMWSHEVWGGGTMFGGWLVRRTSGERWGQVLTAFCCTQSQIVSDNGTVPWRTLQVAAERRTYSRVHFTLWGSKLTSKIGYITHPFPSEIAPTFAFAIGS